MKFTFWGCIVLLFICSCSTISLGHSPSFVESDAYGLAHAGEKESDYPFISKMGSHWIRQTFRWDNVNPEQNEWDFERFDSLMDLADRNGIKVIAVLAYDVEWIYPGGRALRNISPELSGYYLEYVRRVVERYRGRVDAWEIWNEPNIKFWKGADSDFFALASQTGQLINEIDKETPLLVGATFRTPEKFIRGLYEYGAFEYADALSIHPYAATPAGVSRQIIKAQNILEELSLNRELWITEIGYPTRGIVPSRVSETRFAEYVIKTLTISTSLGVRVTTWFKHFDTETSRQFLPNIDYGPFFGLGYKDGSLKDGGRAFSIFTNNLNNLLYDPAIVDLEDSLKDSVIHAAYRDSEGERIMLILWCQGIGDKNIMVSGPDGLISEIDFISGNAGPALSEWSRVLTRDPVLLEISGISNDVINISKVLESR